MPVAGEQQVAGVHVGVDEAVEEDHLRDAAQARERQLLPALGHLGRLHAVDELHREHPARAQVGVEIGHADAGIAGEVLREAAVVAGLEAEIELGAQRGGEALDHSRQGDPAHLRQPVEQACAHVEDGQVSLNLGLGPQPLDLDGHDAAVLEQTAMDLRDARGGHRDGVDGAEPRAALRGQLQGQHPFDLLEGRGRDGVVEPRQGGRDAGRKDVGTGGRDLAELDEGGPQALERAGQDPAAQGVAGGRPAPSPQQAREEVTQQRRQQHQGDDQGAGGDRECAHGRRRRRKVSYRSWRSPAQAASGRPFELARELPRAPR